MCKNIEPTKIKVYTGYKVVVKKNNKYYSPSTGALYFKKGTIGKPKLKQYFYSWLNPLLESSIYEEKMTGNTSIFKEKDGARDFYRNSSYESRKDFVILKIKLGNIKYKAEFLFQEVLIGSKILSMEEIKI